MALCACGPLPSAAPGLWRRLGPLPAQTTGFAVAPLEDGGAILVGGESQTTGSALSDVFAFDSRNRTWSRLAPLPQARAYATASTLRDGSVLVAGGDDATRGARSESFLYVPSARRWLTVGRLHVARLFHTATVLRDGRVLVAGGTSAEYTDASQLPFSSAELYDPSTRRWREVASMHVARSEHAAILAADGRAVVAGGLHGQYPTASVEAYDEATDRWAQLPDMMAAVDGAAAAAIGSSILVAGGSAGPAYTRSPIAFAEVLQPRAKSWTPTGSMPEPVEGGDSALTIPDGRVVVVESNFAYVFDPSSNQWEAPATLGKAGVPAANRTVLRLRDGTVLAPGGVYTYVFEPTATPARDPGLAGVLESPSTTVVLVAAAALLGLVLLAIALRGRR